MGISRRNPRGNFNWQSRYLKKKAICCGQLNEPVDCNLFAPIPVVSTSRICVTMPSSTQVIGGINLSNVPSAFDQTVNASYTLYKDGVVIDTQLLPFGSYEYYFTGTLASAGLYELEITNQWGCTAKSEPKQIEAYLSPEYTVSKSGSTIPCPPGVGDGEITLTIDSPVPGYTYAFNLCYDIGAGPVCANHIGTSTSYTFTGLCNLRYVAFVGVIVPGGNPVYGECTINKTVDLP